MRIKELIKKVKGNTLYYAGCVNTEDFSSNYKEILNKLGVKYIYLPKEKIKCGATLYELGYKKDFRKIAIENNELFKKNNINKIIASCSICYYTLKKVYPEIIKDFNIEIEHISITILNALIKNKINFKGKDSDKILVSYQDPCYLGRYCNIYEEPRKVIVLLGGKIIEMEDNKEKAFCCGAGGGLYINFPDIAKDIAKKRVNKLDENVVKLIVPCNMCYSTLSKASNKSEEFSCFVLNKLNELNV